MNPLDKYRRALKNLPHSGGGGCHTALLGVANYGVCAGIDPLQIFDDLRQHVHGSRRVPNREIKAAIKKAQTDIGKVCHFNFKERQQRLSFDGKKVLSRIIAKGNGITEADIWSASPIKIDWPPEADPLHLLKNIFPLPGSLIFIGERSSKGIIGRSIRTTSEWISYFENGGRTFPHFIPNPLSGLERFTQDGKPSLRADGCVKSFRFAVVEFDGLSREEQLAFWWAVRLPVVALIDSGNKSIHGLIKIDNVCNSASWEREVEQGLFKQLLTPLGVDGSCRNEARLSRLPGHLRDNGNWQRLLYLAPEGRRVSI